MLKRFAIIPAVLLILSLAGLPSRAQELRLPLPKKSKYTPVQQLNRDGVKALQKHEVDKAKRYFYKAYLIDPNDPFTLNNLGYVSELEGDIDRAQRYYDQARANTSDAVVDKSTEQKLEGKAVAKIAGHTEEDAIKVNELNSEALRLLNNDRAPEADLLLQQALKVDPKNPFTLNNMGFAKEKEGEIEDAIRFYSQSAATGSREPIIVTFNKDWRGRPISEVAARNAEKANDELKRASNAQDRVARLNLRGVSAMNRNDRAEARKDFQEAYKLDPSNSFTINNMGYLAELEGDRETAQSFYEQAQNARRASARVAVATRPEAEGREVGQVAGQSTALVESSMQAQAEARRRSGAPPALHTRDNRVIIDKGPIKPSKNSPDVNPPSPGEQSGQGMPQSDQPEQPETGTPTLKTRPPQNQQPPSNQPPANQPPQ